MFNSKLIQALTPILTILLSLTACHTAEIASKPIAPLPTITVQPTQTAVVDHFTPTPSPSATPLPVPPTLTQQPIPATTTPSYPIYEGPPLDSAVMGIQIHLHNEETALLLDHLKTMKLTWVKTQISWKLFQPEANRFDDMLFQELDELVALAKDHNIKIMLSVAKAPEWSRPTTEMDGPPLNPADFANFMTLLATRYQGEITAYELWNETNLQREWNGADLNGAALVELIAQGSAAVRASDPAAQIISGAPAPTGINDGVTAVDDRLYFQQMVSAGLAQWVDGFGIHPYGWVNPPASQFGTPDPKTISHNDHPSFFFTNTLTDYMTILHTADIDTEQKQLWATEFGWGSVDQFDAPAVVGAEFMDQVDEQEQALYIAEAFAYGQANPAVGPMILWNLNFAPTFGPAFSESAYSVIRPDGTPRPIYHTLTNAPRIDTD